MSGYVILLSIFVALFIVRMALGSFGQFSKIDFAFADTIGNCEIYADNHEWSYFEDELLLTVANGIGSETKGRTAAIAASHTVSRVFSVAGTSENPAYFFQTSFRGANNAVLRYIPDGSAGASLLAVVIKNGILYYALAGNCQIGVLRGGELIQLSEGHTFDVLAKKAFRDNKIRRVDALHASDETKVYNFIGKDQFKDLELFDIPVILKKGDVIILMTDGVFDFHPHIEIEHAMRSRGSASQIARKIIHDIEKENYDYQDNATVGIIKINSL